MNFDRMSLGGRFALSLLFDALGYVSFIFPPFDFVWAPLSGYLMTKMYKGTRGKIAGVIAFIEEALPGFDIIPTFTLMWIYNLLVPTTKEQDKLIEKT